MGIEFRELDYRQTSLGELSLRRRTDPALDGQLIYEVKLGDEFLMSSLFTAGEVALAELGLDFVDGENLDVVVGGLGLGHTAATVLENRRVKRLRVIEIMQAVIDWHEQHLVPLGKKLSGDKRCQFVNDDFFKLAAATAGSFDDNGTDDLVDALLLDIDHAPDDWLVPENAHFYSEAGLKAVARKIRPNGVFGLWSNDPVDATFSERLGLVFKTVQARVISFSNPYTGGESTNTVYLCRVADSAPDGQDSNRA